MELNILLENSLPPPAYKKVTTFLMRWDSFSSSDHKKLLRQRFLASNEMVDEKPSRCQHH
jgi:hypothetical protein